jgi:hypothetical protein
MSSSKDPAETDFSGVYDPLEIVLNQKTLLKSFLQGFNDPVEMVSRKFEYLWKDEAIYETA